MSTGMGHVHDLAIVQIHVMNLTSVIVHFRDQSFL